MEGLCGPLRKRIVSKWMADQLCQPSFLCLQEIKVKGFRLDAALNLILPNHRAVVSLPNLGFGGTMILVHLKIDVVDSRGFQKGQVAWVIVNLKGCRFGVMNVYAPNSNTYRKKLWNQIKGKALDGEWFMAGDFNMTEDMLDSSRPSLLIKGEEKI